MDGIGEPPLRAQDELPRREVKPGNEVERTTVAARCGSRHGELVEQADVGGARLVEGSLRGTVTAPVRVGLTSTLPKGPFDLRQCRAAREPQNLVRVTLRHGLP